MYIFLCRGLTLATSYHTYTRTYCIHTVSDYIFKYNITPYFTPKTSLILYFSQNIYAHTHTTHMCTVFLEYICTHTYMHICIHVIKHHDNRHTYTHTCIHLYSYSLSLSLCTQWQLGCNSLKHMLLPFS
jgi:hypothetical protein